MMLKPHLGVCGQQAPVDVGAIPQIRVVRLSGGAAQHLRHRCKRVIRWASAGRACAPSALAVTPKGHPARHAKCDGRGARWPQACHTGYMARTLPGLQACRGVYGQDATWAAGVPRGTWPGRRQQAARHE